MCAGATRGSIEWFSVSVAKISLRMAYEEAFVCSLLCSSVFLSLAVAKDKHVFQMICGKPFNAHSIDVGDRPNHSYKVSQTTCTAAKGEVEGIREQQDIGARFTETSGDTSQWHGVLVVTAANGDKIHYTYANKGPGKLKDGQFQSGSEIWSIVGELASSLEQREKVRAKAKRTLMERSHGIVRATTHSSTSD
jgi:hypothetical protein